jgi:hypothetical protein
MVTPFLALGLSACITTSMQSYADRELPGKPVSHIIAYVSAPGPLAASVQGNVQEEARKRHLVAEDALSIFPPTRQCTDA